MKEQSPTIILSADNLYRQPLERKLEEYRGRLASPRSPESRMSTICKFAILEALLRDGKADTWNISQALSQEHGYSFDVKAFETACNVIIDYCNTGGANVWGGTGLE